MGQNVSLAQLTARAQQLSDTQRDSNVSAAEWTALANAHLTELYDRLVDAGPADYYASTTQITTSDGVIPYPLPDDFRNLVAMFVRGPAPDDRRVILPMPEGARASFRAPVGSGVVLDLEYIPAPPTLVDGGDTLDGVSGWGELIANIMARDVMIKRESLTQDVLNNIARLEARITQRSRQRDRGPKRTVDLDDVNARRWASPFGGWSGSTRIACYRLRADNVELYEPMWSRP